MNISRSSTKITRLEPKKMVFYLIGVIGLLLCHSLFAFHSFKAETSQFDTTISQVINKSFTVTFKGCPTCGFSWFLEPVDTTKIKLLSKTIKPINKDPGMVGGYALETWTFVGLRKGVYQFVFYYKRPWLEERSATKRIRVIIE